MIFGVRRRLNELGIVGINRRNAEYVMLHNSRRAYPIVDNKLLTKRKAQAMGIPVPDLITVVEIQRQANTLAQKLLQLPSGFVIKPGQGSGGEGIIVVTGRMKDNFRRSNGSLMDQEEFRYHILRVLSGVFSLGGHPDIALIETRVIFDPLFERVTYAGVPDIRIITFYGVPVMAMVRLPTRLSDGKANLHQGAVGAGIDIASGATLSGVWRNSVIIEHPDTGHSIVGIQIPDWPDILRFASRCFELSNLGYQGVDIVLDRDQGALLLELNARPGLNIQIANKFGLRHRLELIEKFRRDLKTEEDRVQFAMENFASEQFPVREERRESA